MQTLEEPKVPNGWFNVPGGLLIEEEVKNDDGSDDTVINQYSRVELRELTGHEEDILANTKIGWLERLHRVLGRCIVAVENPKTGKRIEKIEGDRYTNQLLSSAPSNMLLSDNTVLLLRLREVSIGDEYIFKIRCPKCTITQTRRVKLSDFKVKETTGDPLSRTRTFEARNNVEVVWEMATGNTQLVYSTQKKKHDNDRATQALMMRVKSIGGKPATKETLKDLSMLERQRLRRQIDGSEGGIDTSFDTSCTNCGIDFETDMQVGGEDFFTPLEEETS